MAVYKGNSMKMDVYCFIVIILTISVGANASCFVQNTCYDEGSDKTYENGDFWYSAEQKCYGCLCAEHKHYVMTCMEHVGPNKTAIRIVPNKGLLGKMLRDIPYAHLKNPDVHKLKEEETELTEEDAMNIRCHELPKPYYDETEGYLHYPKLKIVHYMFVTRQSYCCRKAKIPDKIHPFCKIREVDRCDYQVVMRRNPNKKCPYSYTHL